MKIYLQTKNIDHDFDLKYCFIYYKMSYKDKKYIKKFFAEYNNAYQKICDYICLQNYHLNDESKEVFSLNEFIEFLYLEYVAGEQLSPLCLGLLKHSKDRLYE